MLVDILDYLVLPSTAKGLKLSDGTVYGRETHGWEGTAFDVLTPDKWTRLKNSGGRWDIKLYDHYGVYDWITEIDDKVATPTPRNYKKFVGNRAGADGSRADGVKMFPRYITLPSGARSLINTTYSDFRMFYDCKWNGVPHNLGVVTHELFGPVPENHGGDIGVAQTLLHLFRYGQMVEFNKYALNFGWVYWQELIKNLATGLFDPSPNHPNPSIHNRLVKCAVPKVDFPCF